MMAQDLKKPDQPLTQALTQAVIAEKAAQTLPTASPLIEKLRSVDPQLAKTLESAHDLGPDEVGDQILEVFRNLPEDDLQARERILEGVVGSPGEVPARIRLQIALRQLEIPSSPDLPSEDSLKLLTLAAQAARNSASSDQERLEVLRTIQELHPSQTAREAISRELGGITPPEQQPAPDQEAIPQEDTPTDSKPGT
jgi:hypothetical protein